jgi:microcystin-dependent protein
MSNPYLGEVRMFGGNFAPIGWALCDGSLLSIPSNTALFSLIGTSYGGDGVNTFALPNLQCCVPVHTGTYQVGQALGSASTVLGLNNLPQHTHALGVSSAPATSRDPTAGVFANSGRRAPLRPQRDRRLQFPGDQQHGRRHPHHQPAALRRPHLHHLHFRDLPFPRLTDRQPT